MADIMEQDNGLIDIARKSAELPKPIDFENGRIDHIMVENLIPLLHLPFDDKAIEEGGMGGFRSKGVPYGLQLNRLQYVFGTSHVLIEHRVDGTRYENGNIDDNGDEKKGMYYCKVKVFVKIGNWTFYTDNNNMPCSNFVTYYQAPEGIGFGGGINEGAAEKNAVANGVKDSLSKMGMLRSMHLECDDNDGPKRSNGASGTVELTEVPTIFSSGALFLKGKAKDKATGDAIDIIVYRDNNRNPDEHSAMVKLLNDYKSGLVAGKELAIVYRKNEYQGNPQYVINKVINKQEE